MKAMSKLFLIISGIMTGVGIVICIIGLIMAKQQGVQLYAEKVNGNSVYTVDLNGTDISKISVNATDADITVYTGQENEYIDFINFNESYGSVSSTNTVVSFDEYVNFNSLLSFWDGGFTFKGMRSLLDFSRAPEGKKEVNIYISDKRNINVFAFTVEKGVISFDNLNSDTDYKLSLDSGTINMKNVATSSKVYLKATGCTASLDNCSFNSFIGDVGDLKINGKCKIGDEFNINAKSGTLDASLELLSENPKVSVITSGVININGETYPGVYKIIPDETSDKSSNNSNTAGNRDGEGKEKMNICITGDTLNVTLNYTNTESTPEKAEEEGEKK